MNCSNYYQGPSEGSARGVIDFALIYKRKSKMNETFCSTDFAWWTTLKIKIFAKKDTGHWFYKVFNKEIVTVF